MSKQKENRFKRILPKAAPGGARLLGAFCLLLCVLAALVLAVDTLGLHRSRAANQDEIAQNVAALEEAAQSALPELNRTQTGAGGATPVEDSAEERERILALDGSAITKAQIAARFDRAAVVGDSIAEAIPTYGFLDNAHVFSKIGVSLSTADEQFDACVQAYPDTVFLVFGLNDLELYGSRVDRFADEYRTRLEQLQSALPDAALYALAILPVQEWTLEEHEEYQYLSDYNAALEDVCAETGVHYVDAGFLLEAMPELYDEDGVHPTANFYPYWFTYLGDLAGL